MRAFILRACLVAVSPSLVLAQTSPFQYINPLIGTSKGGHNFPGATLPFGMAKAVADVNVENQGGFASEGNNVTGFSHMHDSGTGGSPSLGNFPLFPQAGCAGDTIDGCMFPQGSRATPYVKSSVIAQPGYFSIELSTNIRAEMTVSNHTALYRFTFPTTPTASGAPLSPMILADLIDLPQTRTNGSVSVDATSGRITGTGTFSPSFGVGTYDLHFCADFSGASIRDTGVFLNNRAGNSPKNLTVFPDGVDSGGNTLPAGAWVWFDAPTNSNRQILARVGVSFISTDQACSNAETEIPTYDFHGVRAAAKAAWVDKVEVVQVDTTGISKNLLTTFWSGIYRSMISPQDYTGENPLWTSSEPYYDSYYCIWDSFRSIHPLLTLLDQESQSRMMRSLVDIYRNEGWLPDCRMSLCKGFTQGGSNADNVLTDAYLKNISGVDWATAFEAVVQDAEVEPAIWSVQGRGGLASWKSLDYIPTDDFDPYGVGPFTRSISRTVEYAYNDFCIASMALKMGNNASYETYSARSSNWKNMFDESSTSLGYTSFLQPRYLNGTYGYQNPQLCSPLMGFTDCYLNANGHETYEGSSWLYSILSAPGDMAALLTMLGGPNTFVSRLDYLHDKGLVYIGDEQAFQTVYLYHYAGRPGLSASRSHSYIPSQFNNSLNGIPGNGDSGAMGSFVALSMMGLFPNPGQNVYLITPPYFACVNITNQQTGKTAVIINVNFDSSYNNIWIQSATLNGAKYTKNWIDHSFFLDGGVLELVLGGNESTWGTADADLPPSLSTTGIHL